MIPTTDNAAKVPATETPAIAPAGKVLALVDASLPPPIVGEDASEVDDPVLSE